MKRVCKFLACSISFGTMRSESRNRVTVVSSGKNIEYKRGMNAITFIIIRIRVM